MTKILTDKSSGIQAIQERARLDGSVGKPPSDPDSPIYYQTWCEAYREYAIAQKDAKSQLDWEGVPF